ncbi:MAG: PKD domain-containing protein [Gemmatimonadetes bacterium]|nr:PKD domain-containing protein [Gemmatimonadota bacterium]
MSDDKLIISQPPDLGFLAGDDLCGQTIDVHVPGAEAKTWINAQSAIEKSRSLFPARTAVTVLVNPSYSIYPGWANGCWYLDNADVISILDGRDGRHGCLWGRWGSFVFAHEYGHALHHQSLGGLYRLDNDCAVHHGYTEESMVCAYQEGWADYHALRTEPVYNTPGYHYNSAEDYENNRGINRETRPPSYVEFTPKVGSNGSRADGSRYHGEVTAFFYDLFDPANETHDLLELEISDVMDVMASCRVSRDTVTAAPSGIDHLIWCLEARVDTMITRDTTYFGQRTNPPEDWVPPKNFHPTAQNQDSVSWSPNHIRRLWRANLYRLAADSSDLERPSVPDSVPDRINTPDSAWPALPAVTNEPPVAHLVVTCEVLPTCLFDGSESSDDGGITSYTWYANHVVLASGTGDTLRHRFAKPGKYFITLSVEDEQGRWASVTRPDTTIKVPDYAPTAGLVVKCSALHCRFDGSGSTDDVGITSYAWHVDGDSVAVDTVSTRDHTFAAQGNHSVQLTVADSAGQTNATTVIVNVSTGDSGSDIATACGGPDCVPEADSLRAAGIATRGGTLDRRRDVARHFARGRRARQGGP